MIKLDISTIIFFYTLFSGIITLILWIISGYSGISGFLSIPIIYEVYRVRNTYIDSGMSTFLPALLR